LDHRKTIKIALIAACLGALGVAVYLSPIASWALALVDYVRGAGAVGVAIYGLVYVGATVLLIPGSLLTIGAGFVWGVGGGFLLVLPAALCGATLAFLLGRSVVRPWVGRKVEGSPRLAAVDEAVGEQAFRVIALLRLSPLVPFTLLNYVLGASRARLREYVLASGLAMAPGTLLYVYLGSLITNAAALASGERPDGGVYQQIFFWGGLVATAAATVLVSRLARRKLQAATAIAQTPAEAEGHAG
jgi:uncharacterized membrane protein YdjX (TVP38/TMEM64 family)